MLEKYPNIIQCISDLEMLIETIENDLDALTMDELKELEVPQDWRDRLVEAAYLMKQDNIENLLIEYYERRGA